MAKKSKESAPQDEEVRKDILERAPSGAGVATGVAKMDQEEPDEKGGNEDLIAGKPTPDHAGGKATKPEGLQSQPAKFAVNGSVNSRMVATSAGPVPVSAVASSPEEAEKLLEEKREQEVENLKQKRELNDLSEEQIRQMSSAEARSVLESRFGKGASETSGMTASAARRSLQEAESERQGSKKGSDSKKESK